MRDFSLMRKCTQIQVVQISFVLFSTFIIVFQYISDEILVGSRQVILATRYQAWYLICYHGSIALKRKLNENDSVS